MAQSGTNTIQLQREEELGELITGGMTIGTRDPDHVLAQHARLLDPNQDATRIRETPIRPATAYC